MNLKQKIRNRALAALTALVVVLPVAAADDSDSIDVVRPVASMSTVEVGHASLLDTYLTPITYTGVNLRLGHQSMRAMKFSPERWVSRLEAGIDYDNVQNMVGNNTMHSLMVEGRWAMMRRYRDVFTTGLQLMAGGMAQLRGGAIYDPANSNNVVAVKIHPSVGLAGAAVYGTRIGSKPLTLSCHVSLPVIGAFFSPDYDESYYEIYLGNRSGLVHAGWWGNRFDMDTQIAADIHLGETVLRLGYRNRIERSWVSNINTRITTHALVLGIGGEFLGIGRKGLSSNARIISSIY